MVARNVIYLVLSTALPAGCVVGAQHPPSRLDVARANGERPSPDGVTGMNGKCAPAEARPARPPGDVVWVDGYYHDDGIHSVWVPGRWEPRPSPNSWK